MNSPNTTGEDLETRSRLTSHPQEIYNVGSTEATGPPVVPHGRSRGEVSTGLRPGPRDCKEIGG